MPIPALFLAGAGAAGAGTAAAGTAAGFGTAAAQAIGAGALAGFATRAERLAAGKRNIITGAGAQVIPQYLATQQYGTQQRMSQGQAEGFRGVGRSFQADQQYNSLTHDTRERDKDRALQLQMQTNRLNFEGQFQGEPSPDWYQPRQDHKPHSPLGSFKHTYDWIPRMFNGAN